MHTLALPITNKLVDLYATADVQAITTLLAKMGKSYIDRSTVLLSHHQKRIEDNLVSPTGLIMLIGHRKDIGKPTFRALALRRSD